MLDYKLKIGLVPERRWLADAATRRGIFQPSKAVDNKNEIVKYISRTTFRTKTPNLLIWNS